MLDIEIHSEISPRGGRYSPVGARRGHIAGQGLGFWPRCPEKSISFNSPLS